MKAGSRCLSKDPHVQAIVHCDMGWGGAQQQAKKAPAASRGYSAAVMGGEYEGVGGQISALKGQVEDSHRAPSNQVAVAG